MRRAIGTAFPAVLVLAAATHAATLADVAVGAPVVVAARGGTGFQARPTIARGDACYLVAWQDGAEGYDTDVNILGARVSCDGKPLDPEAIVICKAPHDQRWPRVAWSREAGMFLVAWEDQRCGTPDFDVYAARLSPEGKVLDPDGFPIAPREDRNQCGPDVAAVPGGGFVVTWMEYWTFPVWGVFGARVGADGKVLDLEGVALLTKDPQKEIPRNPQPWVQQGYLFPRLAAREGKVLLACAAPGAPWSRPLQGVELTTGDALAAAGEVKTSCIGMAGGPRNYGFALGGDGRGFLAVTFNGERGGGHLRTFFNVMIPLEDAPSGSAASPAVYFAGQPFVNRGQALIEVNTACAFDGRQYWVFYEFGSRPTAESPGNCDIVGFRVDPKEPRKAIDVVPWGQSSNMSRGAVEVACCPSWEVQPAVASGQDGRLLVVYAHDKARGDRRVEARLVHVRQSSSAHLPRRNHVLYPATLAIPLHGTRELGLPRAEEDHRVLSSGT